MNKLALQGGKPVRSTPFPKYNSIGEREKKAAIAVLDSGLLSDYIGVWGEKFEGGRHVRALEQAWAARFGTAHAVTVNTATSGLYAAIGALGIGPGDEVIVSPYTMSASATCALIYGATPVFADIEEDFFCLDPRDVARKITPSTKAIVVVDLAGQPAALDEIMALARKHNLKVVEDCAQAPGALYKGRSAGTVADIGVYSLNCHKTIQTGEGGVAVTNDPKLALRLKLIRNHAEAVVGGMPDPAGFEDLLGWNYRMTEIEAAIGLVQLERMDSLNKERVDRIAYLNSKFVKIPGLIPPPVRPDCSHVYYIHMLRLDAKIAGVSRDAFAKALRAEGVPVGSGYMRPLYRLPLFAKRLPGAPECPVAERLFREEVLVNSLIYPPLERADLDDIVRAYEKVAENAAALQTVEA